MFIFVLGTIFNSGAMTVFFALMLVLMIPVWLFSIRKLYEYDRKDRED
jgi:ATP/ADP translocase